MIKDRRSLLKGLLAAPVIIRVAPLMRPGLRSRYFGDTSIGLTVISDQNRFDSGFFRVVDGFLEKLSELPDDGVIDFQNAIIRHPSVLISHLPGLVICNLAVLL